MKKAIFTIIFLTTGNFLFAISYLRKNGSINFQNQLVCNKNSCEYLNFNFKSISKVSFAKFYCSIDSTKTAIFLINNLSKITTFTFNGILKKEIKNEVIEVKEIITESFSFNETNAIRVFPMPVIDELNINWKVKNNENLNLLIYNVKGKLVKIFNKLQGQSYTTSATFLKAGVYILKLKNELTQEVFITRKFVKK